MADNRIEKDLVKVKLNPTLFVFLGTTSAEVGWRLKKLFTQAYGDIPILKYLFIDIDTGFNQEGREIIDNYTERVQLNGFDPNRIIEHIDNHPYIKAWWPENAPSAGFLTGSGGSPRQMRLIGRLAFFSKFNDNTRGPSLYTKLTNSLNSLKEIQNLDQVHNLTYDNYEFDVENESIRVYIIFSPCGGTGSSMAFDVAYLCRHFLSGNHPQIIGVCLAPSIFDEEIKKANTAQRKMAMANAYAWFKEHHFLLEHPEWDVRYNADVHVKIEHQPFDNTYVVGIENQKGQRLNSMNDVANMISQAIFSSIGTNLGGRIDQHAQNAQQIAEYFQGKPCAYSSLAAATLIFPNERLSNYCARRHSERIILEGLLSKKDISETQILANYILTRNRISDKDLINSLLNIPRIVFSQEQNLRNSTDVPSAIGIIENQYTEVQLLVKDRQNLIEKNYNELLKEKKKILTGEIIQIVKNQGFAAAISVIENIVGDNQSSLESENIFKYHSMIIRNGVTQATLNKEKQEYEQTKNDIRNLDNDAFDKIERTFSPKKWEKKFQAYKSSVIKQLKDLFEVDLLLTAQDNAKKILIELAGFLSDIRKVLENNCSSLHTYAGEFNKEASNLLTPTKKDLAIYEFAKEIEVDFDKHYREFSESVKDVRDFGFFPTNISTIESLNNWVKNDAKNDLINFSRIVFAPHLTEISMLKEIDYIARAKAQKPNDYLQDLLTTIENFCVPFFKYDSDIGVQAPETEKIIGIENSEDPIVPKDEALDFSFKTTRINDRIDFAVFQHGLPIHVLEEIPVCQLMYREKLEDNNITRGIKDPLHILPGIDLNSEEPVPETDVENKELFVIGMAFKYIAFTGRNYYIDKEQEYFKAKRRPSKEYFLGNSRKKAKETFAKNSEYVKEIRELVDRYIEDIGVKEARIFLDKVIEEYQQKTDEYANRSDATLEDEYKKEIEIIRKFQGTLEL